MIANLHSVDPPFKHPFDNNLEIELLELDSLEALT